MTPIAIIDCAIETPSYHCLNRLAEEFEVPFTYHWVSREGLDSLYAANPPSGHIIFGSSSNVHQRLPWQVALAEYLKASILRRRPCLGLCFGHQLIADAFGAKIDLAHPSDRLFEGTRTFRILTDHFGFSKGEEAEIFITHHYEVKNLPEGFIHLGTSADCLYDAIAHESLPYFGVQGHPEAGRFFIRENFEKPISEDTFKRGLAGGNRIIAQFIDLVKKSNLP